ncbi:MAG: metal ABC transporter ATP-binding protein [Armatimonadota bacterium]
MSETQARQRERAGAAQAPVVEMREVCFAYDGPPVLEDATFTIPALDFVGVVGPNGGGKTTLVKLMLGLLEPDRGSVRLFGRPPAESARRVGYVPQGLQYDRRLPITVADVVLMGHMGHGGARRPGGRASERARAEVARALEVAELPGLEQRHFADLSIGQQQRVLIARALATQPELLVLDEPTASLDVVAERDILDLLGELNRRMTIILVTHDVGFVSSAVRTVLCVNRRVRRHPTAELGQMGESVLACMYGRDMRMVRHDQSCGEEGACG